MNWTDKITVTHEDNMELMARYPDKYFDLAVCDPQYGIRASTTTKKPKSKKWAKGWDNKPPSHEYFKELKRVSKEQIIFGVNYFDYYLGPGRLVWDKMNGENDQYGCEIAYVSMNDRTDIVHYLWSGMMQGLLCSKVILKALIQQGNKALNEKRIHPTQKPVNLYEWILIEYGKPDMKILDTHLGSGSLAIACDILDFELTACELDKEHYDDAFKRFKEYSSQQKLKFK